MITPPGAVRAVRAVREGSASLLPVGVTEVRGEFVLVIAPPQQSQRPAAGDTDALLRQALKRVSLKDAVGEVADATGLPRREVYQRALALAKDTDHGAPR